MAKAVEIEFLMKDNLSEGLGKAGRGVDALKQKAQDLRGMIALLEAQLGELRRAGETASPDLDQSKNIAKIEALQKQIKELEAELVRLENASETVRVTPQDIPQARQQFNGLHNSIQQIAREMPSLAMGPQMFFMAISNNLPIFTDELARAKKEYDELVKSGQKGVPVWKQVLSSLFSWQTALTTGIMLLVMYGDKITDWVVGLFNARKELDATAREQQELNKAMGEARKSAASQTAQLSLLYKMTQNSNASLRDRKAAVAELQRQYPAYFGNLSQEAILAGQAAGQYRQLANDILKAAYARAYQKRIEVLAEQNVDLQRAVNADTNWLNRNRVEVDRRKQSITTDYARYTPTARGPMITRTQIMAEDPMIVESERRNAALQKNSAQLKANEKAMQSYQNTVLKYQSSLTKLDYGKEYVPPKTTQTGSGKADAENEAEERKKAEERLAEDLSALRRRNDEEEASQMEEGTGKRIAQIREDYARHKAEIEKQEAEFRQDNKTAKAQTGADGLTDGQREELERAMELAKKEMEASAQDVYREEARAMQDYLKQYGTYQERKLAIAEEYAEKIRKVQESSDTEEQKRWKVRSLEEERDTAVRRTELDAIRQDIDWGSVLGSFGVMFKEQLQPTIDGLRRIAGSDEFRSSTVEEQKSLYELISKLEQAGAAWDGDIFKKVSADLTAYQQAMRGYMSAQENERKAAENLASAQERLGKATEGTAEHDAAKAGVETARESLEEAADATRSFSTQVQEATANLQSSSERAAGMFRSLESGLQGLASGSLKGIGQGVMTLDKLFSGNVTKEASNALAKGFQSLLGEDSKAAKALTDALGDTGLAGEIISAVLGMLDMIAQEGLSGIITSLQDTIFGSVNKMLEDVLSGDIILKPLESAVKGISGIVDTLTFGGLSSWLGGNDKEVTETVNRLTESNEYLRESIDRLKERMDETNSTNMQSMDYYKEARAAELEWQENQRAIIRAQAGAWTNSGYGFLGLGGKGSFNKHAPGSDWYGWQEFNDTLAANGINITISSTGDLWGLTPEQMALLRDNNPKAWQELFSGDGHKNPQDAVNEYLEHAGELTSLTDTLYEKLTGVTFDGLYDSFVDTLMDMDADAQDFANDFSKYMMQALLKDRISDLLGDSLEQWYNDFASALEDGKLDDEEIEALRKGWDDLTNKGMAIRDDIASATGYDKNNDSGTSQSGKGGGYTAMTQEQGTKLEGLFTSGLQHWSSMDGRMEEVTVKMDVAEGHLARIEENTGMSAGHLSEIKDEIRKIIRDGLKVK